MKISYRTHPILEKLKSNEFGDLLMYDKDIDSFSKYVEPLHIGWRHLQSKWKNNITTISKAFADAVFESGDSLSRLYLDVIKTEPLNISGTFILDGYVVFINHEYDQFSGVERTSFFEFANDGTIILFYLKDTKMNLYHVWRSAGYVFHKDEDPIDTVCMDITRIINIELFKKYAKVETKFLPPNSKTKDVNCKYVNDTKLNLTSLDSKWFTNLIKSDAFKVRGHFRLQPKKKDGQWTKELIWIEEFKKDGYTAKARKNL
jgi:hypothetical protein